MMKRLGSILGERGQTLAWVAISLVALLAFVGLAIDGGAVYATRRQMQNAADAGALAGARERCFGTNPTWTTVTNVARDYAVARNGAQEATVSQFEGEDWKVQVTAVTAMATSFTRLVGINSITVPATAVAACGKATSGCRNWPIAYNDAQWRNRSCGEKFILWSGEKTDGSDAFASCYPNGDYNCDIDNDGTDEYVLDGRTWADFSAILMPGISDACDSSGCGAAELQYRIAGSDNRGQVCQSWIRLDTCMAGAVGLGQASSVWNEAYRQVGRTVSFPLYDSMGCTMDKDPGNTCGNARFHVTALGCVKIVDAFKLCEDNVEYPCPAKDAKGPKVIVVEVSCDTQACATECGGTDGTVCGPGDVCAVSLVK